MLHSHSSKCSEAIKQGDSLETCPQTSIPASYQEENSPRIYPKLSLHPPPQITVQADLGPWPTIQIQLGAKQTSQSTRSWPHTNDPRDNLEFVSPLLDSCLLKTLRWEQIEDTFTSQETELEDCSVHCCHLGVLARKMPRDGGRGYGGGNQMYPTFPSKFRSSWLHQT